MDPNLAFVLALIQRLLSLPSTTPARARGVPARNPSEPFLPPAPAPVVPVRARTAAPTRPPTGPVAHLPPGVGSYNNPYAGNPVGGGVTTPMIVTDPFLTQVATQTPNSAAAGNWFINQLAMNQDASSLDFQNLMDDIRRQGAAFGPAGARYSGGLMFGPGPVGAYPVLGGGFAGNPNQYVAPGIGQLV